MRLDEMLRERIGEYWSIGYAEGKEGRTQDDEEGSAAATWHAIDGLIKALVADSAKWQALCETQQMLLAIADRRTRREVELLKRELKNDDQG